jgi:hypothetical protein
MSEENPKLAGSGSVYLVSTADASKVGYRASRAVPSANPECPSWVDIGGLGAPYESAPSTKEAIY